MSEVHINGSETNNTTNFSPESIQDSKEKDSEERDRAQKIVSKVKSSIVRFVEAQAAPDWVIKDLIHASYLEEIVSYMRHIQGGQEHALTQMLSVEPELQWYRGGTRTMWSECIGPSNYQFFTEEELNTHVIDGGANGVFLREELARSYVNRTKRAHPVLYRIAAIDLLKGLQGRQVSLISEHKYDLRVVEKDRKGFLRFCREHVHIEEPDFTPLSTS